MDSSTTPSSAHTWNQLAQPGTPRRTTQGGTPIQWRGFGPAESHLPPLVLLHGGHGSGLHWVRNVEALAARRQVWVPDMPGYGESGDLGVAPHAPDRLQRLGEAVRAGVDELVGDQAAIDLAGFSFGTLVCAELTRLRPVRRLALVGAAGHRTPRRPIAPLREWRLPDAAAKAAAMHDNLAVFMFSPGAAIDDVAFAVHAWSCEHTRFRSKALSIGADLVTALQPYRQPVLLLWGEHDVTATPVQAAERLADGRPERQWAVLPGAGHWLQCELADEVNQRLRTWFESDSRPDSVPIQAPQTR